MTLILATFMVSCGAPAGTKVSNRPEGSSEPDSQAPPIKDVTAKGTEITVNGAEQGTSFVVLSETSDISFERDGVASGTLAGVSGNVVRAGKVVSRFKGSHGSVDRKKGVLTLDGQVNVTDEVRGLTLAAKALVYDQDLGRFVAKGDVTVTSAGMVLGPLPEIWATPDLKKIATPAKFQ
ncbi:MAG: hypothetical protein JST30_04935 [Armatimonadetes bacterium]|nr:hypothetical protein [Armatimonadota bacterium]